MMKNKRDKAKSAYLVMLRACEISYCKPQGCDVMTDDCVHKISNNTSRPKVNRT